MNRGNRQRPMVRWFDPVLLVRTGSRAFVTHAVGRIADKRDLQAALDPVSAEVSWGLSDYRDEVGDDGFWLDFVADVGDGWDSTHAVASAISASSLDHDGTETRRGRILVMGGDEVYPDPGPTAYLDRTVLPYRTAGEAAGIQHKSIDLYAIPGNHDWYDGLHAFTELFCAHGRRYDHPDYDFGAWKRSQSRSYFALRLPQKWWLFGVDIQLDKRINASQLDYFKKIVDEFAEAGDRAILVTPEPDWADAPGAPQACNGSIRTMLDLLEKAGIEVPVILAGDLHHYSRYASEDDDVQLITAGGGGAFLHPTHVLPDTTKLISDGTPASLRVTYPKQLKSRALAWKNLAFPVINWDFALVIGAIYALMAWILNTRLPVGDLSLDVLFSQIVAGDISLGETIPRFLSTILKSPEFALVVAVTYLALIFFNEDSPIASRLLLGLVHSAVHFFVLILAYSLTVDFSEWIGLGQAPPWLALPLFFVAMVLVGAPLGGMVFGLFLLITLNVFGGQWTNAFSSLRIANYKNFLRLQIKPDGTLVIYPFGIEKTGPGGSKPHAIEPAIEIA